MPVYNQHNFISDLKLGIVDIAKLFIGEIQIYPNEALITGLAFTYNGVDNSSGYTPFVVTGTEDAQYTLSGSNGATPPSGTQTIPAGGSNTHSVYISSQSTGAPIRFPRVDVATVSTNTPTSFSPPSLQTYDTVQQAAGPAPSYTHTITYYGNSNCTAHTSTAGFTSYNPTGSSSNSYSLSAGESWYTTYAYIYPVAGKEFTSADAVYILGTTPSWVTAGTKTFYSASYYTYVRYAFSWVGQSSAQSSSIYFGTNSSYTQNVSVSWPNHIAKVSHSGYAGSASPLSLGSASVGVGSSTVTKSTVVSDQGSGVRVGSVGYTERSSTYGSNLTSNGGISGLPAGNGDTITFTINLTVPNYRKSRTFSTTLSPITYELYDE